MNTPLISVIIPTFNRAEILRTALDSLLAQTLAPERFEVLVVDNNSRDHTREVVERYCADLVNLRYRRETAQGAAHARNRGLDAARGDYVGLMDDDCKAAPGWLQEAARVIEERRPEIIGGPFFAFYISPRPRWFKDEYGSHTRGVQARKMDHREYAYGGNMFLRREALLAVGGFPVNRGPVGNAIAFGEEIVPQQMIRRLYPGSVSWFEPSMVTYNLVRPEQMKISRAWLEAYAHGRSGHFLFPKDADLPLATASYVAAATFKWLSILGDVVRGLVARDRSRFPDPQNFWFEHTRRRFKELGRLRARHDAWRSGSLAGEKVDGSGR